MTGGSGILIDKMNRIIRNRSDGEEREGVIPFSPPNHPVVMPGGHPLFESCATYHPFA